MTHLRRIMLEELQRRNYADSTARYYLRAVEQFARHFGKSPDKLGLEHLRTYQAYLLKQRKLAVGTVVSQVAALRFFFVRTLKRHEFREFLPYPRERQRLPRILSKGRSRTADQLQREPLPAHAADGSLRHGHAANRGLQAKGQRHRQPAHDHPRGSG